MSDVQDHNCKKALGIDIGGTKILYGVISENGEILSEVQRTSTPKTSIEIYEELKRIIKEYDEQIDVIGISTAGAVNLENTKIVSSTPNLPEGYKSIDFSSLSSKKVYVENDANCACAAEYKIGAGQGFHTVLTVTLGTGIGGGLVSDGRLFRGSKGNALEIGSMKVPTPLLDELECTCGRTGCFEAYASGTGLKNLAQYCAEFAKEFNSKSLDLKHSIYKDKKTDEFTTYDITDGVEKNDAFSIAVFEMWLKCLETGLVSLTDIFNPDCIVISGGMCRFVDTQKLEQAVNAESVVADTVVRPAKTGNHAGMIGAGVLALGQNL